MKRSNLKKLVSRNGNYFFDDALSSLEMKKLVVGNLSNPESPGSLNEPPEVGSCGCHTCANLCCSGFGNSCPGLC